jgi:hypothetical protein
MVPLMGDEEDRFPQSASHSNSANQGNGDDQTFVKKLQEAFLSLTLVKKLQKLFLPNIDALGKKCNQGNQDGTDIKELQEALLCLTLVIYEKMINADGFAIVVQAKAPGQGAFVRRLRTIVEENCQRTPISLRIVKLCGQIAVSMMRNNQYTPNTSRI